MAKCKFKPGQSWLTRAGLVATVESVDSPCTGVYPVNVTHPDRDRIACHTKTGLFIEDGEHPFDLIKKVKPEKPVKAGSNTKLGKEEKQFVKAAIDVTFHVYPDSGAVAAVRTVFKGSKMVHFAVSYASKDEKKFRPSVGKYYALCRLNEGECITIPNDAVEYYLSALDAHGY